MLGPGPLGLQLGVQRVVITENVPFFLEQLLRSGITMPRLCTTSLHPRHSPSCLVNVVLLHVVSNAVMLLLCRCPRSLRLHAVWVESLISKSAGSRPLNIQSYIALNPPYSTFLPLVVGWKNLTLLGRGWWCCAQLNHGRRRPWMQDRGCTSSNSRPSHPVRLLQNATLHQVSKRSLPLF